MAVNIKKALGSLVDDQDPTVTFSTVKKKRVSKAESTLVNSNVLTADDEFQGYYFHPTENPEGALIEPPYPPKTLLALTKENNALSQLIEAMEVNIEGTGQYILNKETKEIDEGSTDVDEFLEEVFPGMSFTSLRRLLRRDQETYGYAFMEVVRNLNGDLVFLRHVDATTVRLIRYDEPIMVEKTVVRGSEETTYNISMSERRFMQISGGQKVFFKEYGASRELNKTNGVWDTDEPVPEGDRATELMMFMIAKDVNTPYGLPRWINQVPSLLGSRKAEELNLDFFNAGGLPPALFVVQGGVMTKEVRKQLQSYLSGKGGSYNRAGVVEVHAAGASLDSGGSVKVSVERFGAERQNDSMFENYDMKCEQRVRSSFRLPSVFVGRTNDNSYAAVFAAYTTAEAQVFEPERREFDEKMNTTIIRELSKGHIIRSKPLLVRDATMTLQGITLAKDAIDNNVLVNTINEAINTEMVAKEEEEMPASTDIRPTEAGNLADPSSGGVPVPGQQAAQAAGQVSPEGNNSTPTRAPTHTKSESIDALELIQLSNEWARYSLSISKDNPDLEARVKGLSGTDKQLFDSYVTMTLMSGMDYDTEGAVELTAEATGILNGDQS